MDLSIDDLVLVSVDDHMVEPPDMFERHVPAKWKDRAPRLLTKKDGTTTYPDQQCSGKLTRVGGSGNSSHATGIETYAPGRARGE